MTIMSHRRGFIAGILLMSATPVAGQSPARDSLALQLALAMNVVAAVHEAVAIPGGASGRMDPAILRRMVEGSRSFVAKYFTPDVVLSQVVPVYAKRFTELELPQLIEFAQSPAGARYLSDEAELRLVAMRVWQTLLAKHDDGLAASVASTGVAEAANDSLARELFAAVATARSQATRSAPRKMDEPGEDPLSARSAAATALMRGNTYSDAANAALVREYARRHGAAELRQLIDFFRSPVGVRFVIARIEIDEIIGALTSEINLKHKAEFSKIITDALSKTPPPP